MNIDWVLSITLFLIIVAWSFSYYTDLIGQGKVEPLRGLVDEIHNDIMSFLEVDVYEVPVRFTSSNSTSDTVLYLNYVWPDGTKNSTRIKQAGTQLSCELSGDAVYWQADLVSGNNFFTMEFAEVNQSSYNCTASLTKAGANQSIPWSRTKKKMLAQTKIDDMLGMSYANFKNTVGVNEDFRVVITNSTNHTTVFGKYIPSGRDVYVPVTYNKLWETGEKVEVSTAIW